MGDVVDRNNRITLAPGILHDIEEALNEPLFLGVSAGVSINDALIVSLYNAKRVWSWRARIKDHLQYFYQRFRQPIYDSKDLSVYKGRIVFTWIFDIPHINALVLPLIEKYRCDDYVVVGSSASMRSQVPEKAAFILWDEFSKINMRAWKIEFDRCLPTWKYRLNQVLKKYSIPEYVAIYLLCRLQAQTKRIMAATQFIEMVKPNVVVTEYDRNAHSSCLVLAAKLKRISSITMIHAAGLEPHPSYGMAPIIANFACCWGRQHKRILVEHGVDEGRLFITGSQSIMRELKAKQEDVRAEIGFPINKPTVLLATSPIKLEDRRHYAMVFCIAMSKLPEISAFIRLHPAEDISEYKQLIHLFPRVKFFPNNAMTKDQSLAATDIVVSHDSAFGNDALLNGKLVIILDVLSTPLRVGKELIDMAGCPSVKGADELASVVCKIFSDVEYESDLHIKAEQYAHEYCHSFGQDAADNVFRVIDQVIKQQVQ